MSTNSPAASVMTVQQAIEEAGRCLLCHDAPCSSSCPSATDPAKFIRQIRFYNFKGASRTVMGNNPLGGVCAVVCPTGDTCRGACLRTELDRPIDIDGLQAFAVAYGREHGVVTMERGEAKEQRVAIVGSGPAGLAAAAMLAQKGYQSTIFEARAEAGGMLRYGVPVHRLDDSVLDADLKDILDLEVEIKTDTMIDREDGAKKLLEEGYNAVFVAPGLWKANTLPIDGIELDGVTTALAFLDDARHKADTLENQVKDKVVCVIGGGSVAMDVCSSADMLGAKRIYVVALEGTNELPAQPEELQEAMEQGVRFRVQSQVDKILGDAGHVTAIEGREIEWIEAGKPIPANAKALDGSEFKLPVDIVVQAIGQAPAERVGQILTKAERNGRLFKADPEKQSTSVSKVFAGGDIVRGPATVVEAVADGKRAAEAIDLMFSQGQEVAS